MAIRIFDLVKLCIVFCLLTGALNLTAQTPAIDSLKTLLPGRSDAELAYIYYELAYEYVDFDNSIGRDFGIKALQLSYRVGDSLTLVKAGKITATAYRRLEKMDSSLAIALKVLSIARRNRYKDELKSLLNGLAVASTYLARYNDALRYNFESLEIREQDGDPLEIRAALNNIGLIYYKIKDYGKAIMYFQRSLELDVDFNTRIRTLDNITLCYIGLADYQMVKYFLNESVHSCSDSCEDAQLKGIAFTSGILHYESGCLDSAKYCFNKSLKLSRKTNHYRYVCDNLIYLARTSLKENNGVLARQYLTEAETLNSMESYPYELSKVYALFITLYKNSRDLGRVATYQSKFIKVSERVRSNELAMGMMRVEADYLERGRKARILYQSKVLALQDDIIDIQKWVNILIGIVACLLIVSVYIYYQKNLKRKRANDILGKKVEERIHELYTSHKLLQERSDKNKMILDGCMPDFKSLIAVVCEMCSSEQNGEIEYKQQIKEAIVVLDSALNALHSKLNNKRIE